MRRVNGVVPARPEDGGAGRAAGGPDLTQGGYTQIVGSVL